MAKSKAKSNKGLKFLVVVLLVIVIAAVYIITALALGKQWNPVKWGKGSAASNAPNTNAAVLAIGSDGEKLTDGSSYKMGRGLTLLTARSLDNNQEYAPDGEITLTATLSNQYINGAFDWSAKFADGKPAANYVSITPDVANSANARLRFLAPFSEQIKVTATLRGTASADVCTVDCLKSVTYFNIGPCFTDFGDLTDYDGSAEFGDGTIIGDFVLKSAKAYLSESFISEFNRYLNFNVNFKDGCGVSNRAFEYGIYGGIATPTTESLEYSMFIEGFDDYDQAHKEAIYYAWYTAYCHVNNNVLVDYEAAYKFKGVEVAYFTESDLTGINGYMFQISGSSYGSDIAPNVTLNKNVVFGGRQ
ncbi:MAG: hypothetical protein K2K60_01215 [Clostridia bacterium]|nr:hypothetical protein [Clostridia bacterium]